MQLFLHAIFCHMMPRSLSNVLRRIIAGAALVAIVFLCIAWPARQVLSVLWPVPVDEVLAISDSGKSAERLLVTDRKVERSLGRGIVRHRPISVWRLELHSGEVVHAWLQGLRDPDNGQLRSPLPDWVEAVRVDDPPGEGGTLVLLDADRRNLEVAVADVDRMYRPNGLTTGQRLALARDRWGERWRWPFADPQG